MEDVIYRDGQSFVIENLNAFYTKLLKELDNDNFTIIIHYERSTVVTKSKYIRNIFRSGRYKLNFISPDVLLYIQVNDFEHFYVGHSSEKTISYIMRKYNTEIIIEFDISKRG